MKNSTKGAVIFAVNAGAYIILKIDIIFICMMINLICECVFVYLDYFYKDNK